LSPRRNSTVRSVSSVDEADCELSMGAESTHPDFAHQCETAIEMCGPTWLPL
jgi:hypothetical protein